MSSNVGLQTKCSRHIEIGVAESIGAYPVTNLRPKVELMYLLRMRRHCCYFWNRQHWTDSESTWTLSCFSFCTL